MPDDLYPVNVLVVGMKTVITQFMDHVEGNKNKTGDANNESAHVQHDVSALFSHIADRINEKILYHDGDFCMKLIQQKDEKAFFLLHGSDIPGCEKNIQKEMVCQTADHFFK